MEDIACTDMKEEESYVWMSKEGMEAMKVMQFGMQYLQSIHRKLHDKASLIHSYWTQQSQQLQKLEEVHTQQKTKMNRYKKVEHKLNEQAVHYEVMLN